MTQPELSFRPLAVLVGLTAVGVLVDQISKAVATDHLVPGQPVPIVSDIFQLRLMRNPGAAFSTGAGMTIVFSILALVVLITVAVFIVPRVKCYFWAVVVGLGLAGVAGNFIDRLVRTPGPFQGHVIDFFALKYFAVFNVADIFLTVAAILVVLDTVFFKIDLDGRKFGAKRDAEPSGEPGANQ